MPPRQEQGGAWALQICPPRLAGSRLPPNGLLYRPASTRYLAAFEDEEPGSGSGSSGTQARVTSRLRLGGPLAL